MNNDMSNMINDIKKMVDNGNLPPDIQNLINTATGNKTSNTDYKNTTNNINLNDMLQNIPPDLISNFNTILNSNSSKTSNNSNSPNNSHDYTSNDSNNNFNIDINMLLKMKSVFENLNNKNDPRANLLYSLKPYLRDTKKDKVDQYINLLNMTKVADIMKNDNNLNKT